MPCSPESFTELWSLFINLFEFRFPPLSVPHLVKCDWMRCMVLEPSTWLPTKRRAISNISASAEKCSGYELCECVPYRVNGITFPSLTWYFSISFVRDSGAVEYQWAARHNSYKFNFSSLSGARSPKEMCIRVSTRTWKVRRAERFVCWEYFHLLLKMPSNFAPCHSCMLSSPFDIRGAKSMKQNGRRKKI